MAQYLTVPLPMRVSATRRTCARDEVEFEASYQIQVTQYATLSLYGEYFDNPDDYEVPFVNHLPSNGLAAGTLLRIPLGPALGTSSKPF